MDKKEIYWHLPGLCSLNLENQILINMMKDCPEKFRDGYKIGSVYGTFPGAIWNGGRAVNGSAGKADIDRVIKTFNKFGIPVRFTWTNTELTQEHVNDTYCNLIMRLADNGMNQILVNRPVLEEYLTEKYPDFKVISSTTKRLTSLEDIKAEIDKGYYLVVLDYDLNHDEEVLKELEPVADKIEILVDEVCVPNCVNRKLHYRSESKAQLEFDSESKFNCPNKTGGRCFADCMSRPAFISNEDVAKYAERGYCNFKLVGRGLPRQYAIDSYAYYLAKPEEQAWVKENMFRTLERITGTKIPRTI